ncbi:MAG: hypothetical protein ACYTG2_12190 [Planctomycetota bacterium]|jgi:hypothetical protein
MSFPRIRTFLVCALALLPACSIEHRIADDYAQYLVNNAGSSALPQVDLDVDYTYGETTRAHSHGFRSWTVGYAHLWIVDFGRILDATLQSSDVQAAFAGLEAAAGNAPVGDRLVFDLERYEFAELGAHVALRIAWTSGGIERVAKTYSADGATQGSKMFWGGPFAMKNAIQQSTKLAIDQVLTAFLHDVRRAQGLTE